MVALDEFARRKLGLGHSAGTDAAEVVFVVDALRAAQLFVAVLLPLGDEVGVGPLLIQAVFVEFFAYFLESTGVTFFL